MNLSKLNCKNVLDDREDVYPGLTGEGGVDRWRTTESAKSESAGNATLPLERLSPSLERVLELISLTNSFVLNDHFVANLVA